MLLSLSGADCKSLLENSSLLLQTVATNACHPGSEKLPEQLYETSQTSTGLWITAVLWRHCLWFKGNWHFMCSSGMAKMEEGEKSRQEKHCWQVKERQAKANPRQEPKGNLKGRTLSPQVKQAAAVQHTAPGSLQLRYHNTGGEGLWLYTATVWQGQFLLHSLHILMFQRHCPMPALRTQVNF